MLSVHSSLHKSITARSLQRESHQMLQTFKGILDLKMAVKCKVTQRDQLPSSSKRWLLPLIQIQDHLLLLLHCKKK